MFYSIPIDSADDLCSLWFPYASIGTMGGSDQGSLH